MRVKRCDESNFYKIWMTYMKFLSYAPIVGNISPSRNWFEPRRLEIKQQQQQQIEYHFVYFKPFTHTHQTQGVTVNSLTHIVLFFAQKRIFGYKYRIMKLGCTGCNWTKNKGNTTFKTQQEKLSNKIILIIIIKKRNKSQTICILTF